MISMMKIGAITGIMMTMSGCGSPQNTYFTLNPTTPANAALGGTRQTVALDGVSIPGELDRPQIVIGLDDNRVDVHEYDRWVEPFEGMVRRILADDLRARLGSAQVLEKANKDSALISVTIDAFGRQGDRVVLRGRWTLKDPQQGETSAPSHSFDQNVPVDPSAPMPATIADMSRLLGAVTDDIALSIGRH